MTKSDTGKSSIALSNLRAVVIIIVIAFHASLAYLASAPAPTAAFNQPPYTWLAFPIVDKHHWLGFDVICAWLDVSMMALMFLLSGLFVAGSLGRKGAWTYVSDRLWRIGLPFLLAVAFLSPISFYPAYLLRSVDPSLSGFWSQWFSLPSWPAGPEWFLWQLLAANLFGAALYAVFPGVVARFAQLAAWAAQRPLAFFALLAAACTLAYTPLALAFSPWRWAAFGPFSLQLCRPALDLVFFFTGFALGSHGIERGLLACDGPLARNWLVWLAVAVTTFALWAGLTSLTLPQWEHAGLAARIGASLAFPLGCVAGGTFILAASLRFASGLKLAILDSLSANAYSMYLLHYVFVVWLQYTLLDSALPAIAKAAFVLACALVMSWISSLAFHFAAAPRVIAVKRAISPMPR